MPSLVKRDGYYDVWGNYHRTRYGLSAGIIAAIVIVVVSVVITIICVLLWWCGVFRMSKRNKKRSEEFQRNQAALQAQQANRPVMYYQPGYVQPGYGQPGYGQPGYPQGGFPPPGHRGLDETPGTNLPPAGPNSPPMSQQTGFTPNDTNNYTVKP